MIRIISAPPFKIFPFSTSHRVAIACLATSMLSMPGTLAAQPITAQDIQTGSFWAIPSELNAANGGPGSATLAEAATFAWREFIALNWPAKQGMRGVPDTTKAFGAASPVVWETMAAKVEIFPGTAIGAQSGYVYPYSDYNNSPDYIYSPAVVGTTDGKIVACNSGVSAVPPYINLDETTQIGLDKMFAGIGAPGEKQIRFLAKANKVEYDYVSQTQKWFGDNTSAFAPPVTATKTYVATNKKSPPAGSGDYVSFPNGTIELKSAWRKLGANDMQSEFYTAPVRFYETDSSTTKPCYVDSSNEAPWGMLALHIIHKTAGAPYFVFATFEQKDNLLTPDGHSVEQADGSLTAAGKMITDPLSPNIQSVNSAPIVIAGNSKTTVQTFTNTTPATTPQSQLYYQNLAGQGLPETTYIGVNKRKHDIPDEVAAINLLFQDAIAVLDGGAVFSNYKLVNVQWVPVDKVAGETYTSQTTPQLKTPGGEVVSPATYYQSNSVVETDYNLQVFSGRFGSQNTITDYTNTGEKFHNVQYNGNSYLMGGCMGCHGNAQVGGTDFSFILEGNPTAPDVIGNASNTEAITEHFQKILRGEHE
jgi:hypothetical protein